MRNVILIALIFGFVSLSSFNKALVLHEQIAFDYFISDILSNDFKDVGEIEFKGKTETTYSNLGDYKFCLKPEERLGSFMKEITNGSRMMDSKQIRYDRVKSVTIANFKVNGVVPKLYLYPSLRIADNFYVFLSFQKPNEPFAHYVIELHPDGKISRSCRMN
jgi:hypothetical protein